MPQAHRFESLGLLEGAKQVAVGIQLESHDPGGCFGKPGQGLQRFDGLVNHQKLVVLGLGAYEYAVLRPNVPYRGKGLIDGPVGFFAGNPSSSSSMWVSRSNVIPYIS